MGNITYEQFVNWCKHWNYTIDEGYKAMCFVANIIGQHCGNCVDYANGNHSNTFKSIVETKKENAIQLLLLYGRLDSSVFEMLEKHDKEANT